MPFPRLSEVLWHERRLLELLLYRLEVEQLVLVDGRTRWVAQASREVEAVLDEIRSAELGRATEAVAAAEALGLDAGASLGELAQAAPAPWDELLGSHRDALVTLTGEIRLVTEGNRELLAMSHRATRETLLSLHEAAGGYDGAGQVLGAPDAARLVDRSL